MTILPQPALHGARAIGDNNVHVGPGVCAEIPVPVEVGDVVPDGALPVVEAEAEEGKRGEVFVDLCAVLAVMVGA